MITKQNNTNNEFRFSDSYRSTLKRKALTAVLVGSIAAAMPVRQANADHPVVVAIIAAVATVEAAAITAGGAVVSAAILGTAAVIASSDGGGDTSGEAGGGETSSDGDGGGDGGNGNDAGGGENRSTTVGEDALPIGFRDYIDRNVTLTAGSQTRRSSSGDEARLFRASAKYNLDGDIKKSKPGTQVFKLNDKLTLRFEITNIQDAKNASVMLNVDKLMLSTEDVPETKGHANIRFTAMQDGKQLWRWSSRVDQGAIPEIKGPDRLNRSVVTRENDMLLIRDLNIRLPYKAPGKNRNSVVEVIVDIVGEGART